MRRSAHSALRQRIRAAIILIGLLGAILGLCATSAEAATLPQGFTDETIWSGLTNPVNIEFAPDGTVFVAEKGGEIKVFDSLSDTTPSAFGTGLAPAVHDFWDRGCSAWRSTRSSPHGPMCMSCTPTTTSSGPAAHRPGGGMAAPTRPAPPIRAAWSAVGCPG